VVGDQPAGALAAAERSGPARTETSVMHAQPERPERRRWIGRPAQAIQQGWCPSCHQHPRDPVRQADRNVSLVLADVMEDRRDQKIRVRDPFCDEVLPDAGQVGAVDGWQRSPGFSLIPSQQDVNL
jgi:hypothetical protein